MSKYNLSELLAEVAGGRIGTLEISARDLVRKMEDLEDKGVRVDRFDGLSPDGKTYIEFHVHPMRKYDEDTSFSIYDYKFGFDPMSPEHSDSEYPFSIGGRSAARDSAETVLRSGDMGFEIKEAKEEEPRDGVKSAAAKLGMKPSHVKEANEDYDLLKIKMEIRNQLDSFDKGIIDGDDLANAMEEIVFGRRAPGVNTDADFEREQRMQMGMREEESIDEADNMEIVTILNNVRKHLVDKFDRRYSKPEFDLYMDSLERDMRRSEKEFDEVKSMSMEDHEINFEDYIADRYDDLAENFKRFI